VAIDDCQHIFKELSKDRLPKLMDEMKRMLESPHSMSEFNAVGVGKAKALKKLKLNSDFQGCYVLSDDSGPLYVGISRGVIQRLIQHVKGKTHFDASFAYKIASEEANHGVSRGDAMLQEDFKKLFNEAKEYIASMKVAFIDVSNDLELYLFEVYCSMELDTSRWNTFRTH